MATRQSSLACLDIVIIEQELPDLASGARSRKPTAMAGHPRKGACPGSLRRT